VPNIDETTRMLRGVLRALPATLPNWQRINWNRPEHPCGIVRDQAERDLSAHVAARQGDRFVIASFGLTKPVECVARHAFTLQVWLPPFTGPKRVEVQERGAVRLDPPAQLTVRN
jgi:hypothetical protein